MASPSPSVLSPSPSDFPCPTSSTWWRSSARPGWSRASAAPTAATGWGDPPSRSRCSRWCRRSKGRSLRWSASTSTPRGRFPARTRPMATRRARPSFSGPGCRAASPRRSPARPWPSWSSSQTSTRPPPLPRQPSPRPPSPRRSRRRHNRIRSRMAELEIRNLHVTAEGKEILKGVSLDVEKGSIHALMGPNGSGKSTLANAIMGHPSLGVTEGTITFKGEDITEASPDERSRMGLFMAFQYPVAIPGVTVAKYMRMAVNAHREADGEEPVKLKDFRKETEEAMALTNIPKEFSSRYLNDGISGVEKKRMEILQLAMLKPELAVLDETDSGLDIDALRVVAEGVNKYAGPDMGVLIITHYQRILHLIKPDAVHVLYDGRIVKEGGAELVEQLEEKGYGWIKEEIEAAAV